MRILENPEHGMNGHLSASCREFLRGPLLRIVGAKNVVHEDLCFLIVNTNAKCMASLSDTFCWCTECYTGSRSEKENLSGESIR